MGRAGYMKMRLWGTGDGDGVSTSSGRRDAVSDCIELEMGKKAGEDGGRKNTSMISHRIRLGEGKK